MMQRYLQYLHDIYTTVLWFFNFDADFRVVWKVAWNYLIQGH